MICHRCGMIFKEGSRFCPGCGLELSGSARPGGASPSGQSVIEPPPIPAPVHYAGFWRRVAAYLVDRFLLGAINLSLCLLYVFLAGIQWEGDGFRVVSLASALFGFLLKWLYFTLAESSSMQATLGKALIGIKVADEQGRRISLARANGRYWAKILSALTFGIGFLMAGFTRRKQALHDLLARTLVVCG